MSSLVPSFNALVAENKNASPGSDARTPPPSVFGIIVVGVPAGLFVGLLAGPNLTLQGFFLGFAGGALVTAGLYFYASERSRPPR